MKDSLTTVTIATGGFLVQLTEWDVIIKFLIGILTLAYLTLKLAVFIVRNWKIIRHPIQYIKSKKGDTTKV
jgi:hypothetical protein